MNPPSRGEIWMVDLGLVAKVCPALVLSISVSEKDRSLVTLVPHTISLRGSRFEVPLIVKFLRAGGFDTQSLVTIPHAKLIRYLGQISAEQLAQIERHVCLWLGLTP